MVYDSMEYILSKHLSGEKISDRNIDQTNLWQYIREVNQTEEMTYTDDSLVITYDYGYEGDDIRYQARFFDVLNVIFKIWNGDSYHYYEIKLPEFITVEDIKCSRINQTLYHFIQTDLILALHDFVLSYFELYVKCNDIKCKPITEPNNVADINTVGSFEMKRYIANNMKLSYVVDKYLELPEINI